MRTQGLNRAKIVENSPDETLRNRGVGEVSPPKGIAGRSGPLKSRPAKRASVVPNLFSNEGSVHRFDAEDEVSISRFLNEDADTSALICGDTERVLSQLPECVFQSCVTSPPYWSLRDYSIPGQIGLEGFGIRVH